LLLAYVAFGASLARASGPADLQGVVGALADAWRESWEQRMRSARWRRRMARGK
jgi:hypothetical protein